MPLPEAPRVGNKVKNMKRITDNRKYYPAHADSVDFSRHAQETKDLFSDGQWCCDHEYRGFKKCFANQMGTMNLVIEGAS